MPNYFGDLSTLFCVLTCPNQTVRDPQFKRRCVDLDACSTSPLYLYGDFVKNLCVNALNCSDGYYADNVTHKCVTDCPGPVYFYTDNVTKECVAFCALGWYALNASSTQGMCSLYCPEDLWADNLTMTCTNRCSASTYGVNYNGSWTTFNNSYSYLGICQTECPDGQFARDNDNLCVSDCGPNLWGDSLSKTCKTSPFDCPTGYYANNLTNLCVLPLYCSYNMSSLLHVADNLTKTCVSKCPNINSSYINYADLNKKLCVARCPHGYFGQNDTLNCQTTCTYPNASTYDGSFADPQTNICMDICTAAPISTFGENATYTCVEPYASPNNTWAEAKVSSRKCVNPCPAASSTHGTPQTFGDNLTHTCVAACPTYTFADLSTGIGLCVYICPNLTNGTYQFADNSSKTCLTVCPASNFTFGDNVTRSCVYTCPSGSFAQVIPSRYCV